LHAGDRILFAGEAGVEGLQRRTSDDDGTMHCLPTRREPMRKRPRRRLARDGGAACRPATVRA
jgi:hypothetical protein